jgi:AbrB family looped-hinge helix DNA binding protein
MSNGAAETSESKRYKFADNFLGTATVGERGQIVIPVEARKKFQIETGDKLLIVGHGEKGMMLLKMDALREFMTRMMEDLERVEEEYQRHDN